MNATGSGVEVFVADEQSDVAVDTRRWSALAAGVLAAERIRGDVELSVLFVDEVAMAELNLRFMGKEGPTDVLSFPIDEDVIIASPRGADPLGPGPEPDFDPSDAPRLLGDVVVCPAVADRSAPGHVSATHDGSVDDEVALLVVHGILHLLGRDHTDDEEAEAMERREQELLDQCHRRP